PRGGPRSSGARGPPPPPPLVRPLRPPPRTAPWGFWALPPPAVAPHHPFANEPVTAPRLHAHLADPLGDRHGGGHNVARGLVGAHDLEQAHDVGGGEEM